MPLFTDLTRPAPAPAKPADPGSFESTVTCQADMLNLRSQPGGEDIGDLLKGQILQVAPGIQPVECNGIVWLPLIVWAARDLNGDVYLK